MLLRFVHSLVISIYCIYMDSFSVPVFLSLNTCLISFYHFMSCERYLLSDPTPLLFVVVGYRRYEVNFSPRSRHFYVILNSSGSIVLFRFLIAIVMLIVSACSLMKYRVPLFVYDRPNSRKRHKFPNFQISLVLYFRTIFTSSKDVNTVCF